MQETPRQLAWDDLRTVLAIARARSLSGAARELGVQHSTVFRRIDAIEARLGVRLFERSRRGYEPTAQGEVVAEAARAMEEAALTAERQVLGADMRLAGVVRLATSELIAAFLLPPLLVSFAEAYPSVVVEVAVSNRTVDLDRREADLALRATATPPEHLVARLVAPATNAVYVAERWLAGGRPPVLAALPWLGFDDRLAGLPQARWLRERPGNAPPPLRFDSLLAMQRAAAAGAGAALLPRFAADQEPSLVRVSAPIPESSLAFYLLHHPEIRGNARIRALWRFLAQRIPERLALLADGGRCCSELVTCPPPSRRGPAIGIALGDD